MTSHPTPTCSFSSFVKSGTQAGEALLSLLVSGSPDILKHSKGSQSAFAPVSYIGQHSPSQKLKQRYHVLEQVTRVVKALGAMGAGHCTLRPGLEEGTRLTLPPGDGGSVYQTSPRGRYRSISCRAQPGITAANFHALLCESVVCAGSLIRHGSVTSHRNGFGKALGR